MQLLEIIDYGPNTFGTDKKSGGNSENIGEIFRWRRKKSPKTPLLAPHIARAKRAKKTKKKHQRRFFAEKTVFLIKSCVFACLGGRWVPLAAAPCSLFAQHNWQRTKQIQNTKRKSDMPYAMAGWLLFLFHLVALVAFAALALSSCAAASCYR